MQLKIQGARTTHTKELGYLGTVIFTVEGHREPYEVTLQSDSGDDWNYSLHFQDTPGDEEEISAVEEWLEQDDDAFDALLYAAEEALEE
ncbi:hypothetical protein [Gorillibacterium timonense]|uniref:hypothetical protein n=1 Tax=Gorillibacterium timonense TaxID=1689269 RepID=UPI00071D736F|nr:hypothetical protein [Gorillibacterium timonense]